MTKSSNQPGISKDEHDELDPQSKRVTMYGWDASGMQKVRVAVNSKGELIFSPTGGSGISTATNTKVSVGSASTSVLASNTDREFVTLVNDSDETIYLSLSGTAVMNEGVRLNSAGGSYEIDSLNLYTGAITAICASGSKNLTVVEA